MLHKEIKRFQAGIYQIKNLQNNKVYIGSSINVYNRFHTHSTKLKYGNHVNIHLQSSYLKYGKDNFIFEVLEYCSVEQLQQLEQEYIDKLNPEYNKRTNATNNKFLKHDEETKDKISKTLKSLNLKGYNQKHLNQNVEVYDYLGNYITTFESALEFSNFVEYNGNYTYEEIEKSIIFKGFQAKLESSNKRIYPYINERGGLIQEVALLNILNKEKIIYPNLKALCDANNYSISTFQKRKINKTNLEKSPKFIFLNDNDYKDYESFEIVNKF